MNVIKFVEIRVVKEPVVLRGRIYRAIEAFTDKGGHLEQIESWSNGTWCFTDDADPISWHEVLAASTTDRRVLEESQVPNDPWPPNYDPANLPVASSVIKHSQTQHGASDE